jgi:hypothetical protein
MSLRTIQKLVLITLFTLSISVTADEKINWTGPYAGIELGHADSNIKLKCKDCNLSTYSDYRIGDTNTQNIKNVIYGAQVGYNFVQNNFLYGAELSYLNLNSHEKTWSEATPAHGGNTRDDTFTSKIGSTLSLSGRLGKVYDNFLYDQSSLNHLCNKNNLSIVKGDVRDNSKILSILPKFDVIIPLAALVGAPICKFDPVGARTINHGSIELILKNISTACVQYIFTLDL